MYKTGDLIIYGSHGVCRVDAVSTPDIYGINQGKLYYTLYSLYHNEKIFTPIDTKIFMRPVISRAQVHQLISHIPSIEENMNDGLSFKLLEGYYKETIQNYDCSDLLKLVKNIYAKEKTAEEQGKKLGQIDTRYLRRAEDLLFGEFAVALDMPKEDVKGYIEDKLSELENIYS